MNRDLSSVFRTTSPWFRLIDLGENTTYLKGRRRFVSFLHKKTFIQVFLSASQSSVIPFLLSTSSLTKITINTFTIQLFSLLHHYYHIHKVFLPSTTTKTACLFFCLFHHHISIAFPPLTLPPQQLCGGSVISRPLIE